MKKTAEGIPVFYEARIYNNSAEFNNRNAATVEPGFMTIQAAESWARDHMQPGMIAKVQSDDLEEIKIFKAVIAFKKIY